MRYIYKLRVLSSNLPVLLAEHPEPVDEGVGSPGRHVLREQLLRHLVVIAEDGGEGPQVDPDQLPELLDEPLGAGGQDPVGLGDVEEGANQGQSPGPRGEACTLRSVLSYFLSLVIPFGTVQDL